MAWLFEQKGVITVPKEKVDLDEEKLFELALEAGAEEFSGMKMIITKLSPVFPNWNRCATTWKGKFRSKKPNWPICPRIRSPLLREEGESLLKLVEALEEHDDVQNVYANFGIAENN